MLKSNSDTSGTCSLIMCLTMPNSRKPNITLNQTPPGNVKPEELKSPGKELFSELQEMGNTWGQPQSVTKNRL